MGKSYFHFHNIVNMENIVHHNSTVSTWGIHASEYTILSTSRKSYSRLHNRPILNILEVKLQQYSASIGKNRTSIYTILSTWGKHCFILHWIWGNHKYNQVDIWQSLQNVHWCFLNSLCLLFSITTIIHFCWELVDKMIHCTIYLFIYFFLYIFYLIIYFYIV